jgi:hypothetical protein
MRLGASSACCSLPQVVCLDMPLATRWRHLAGLRVEFAVEHDEGARDHVTGTAPDVTVLAFEVGGDGRHGEPHSTRIPAAPAER